MSTIASYSPLNISETVRDRPRGLVPAVTVSSHRCGLSKCLLPATAGCPVIVWKCKWTLIQAFVSCRLEYCNSLFFGTSEGLMNRASVGSERRRLSGYWYSTFKPHNASAPSATLAAGTPERRLQGCDARSSVAVWHFHRRTWPTTAVLSLMFASDDYVAQRAEHAL